VGRTSTAAIILNPVERDIRIMVAQGVKYSEIARKYKVKRTPFDDWCRKRGIPTTDPRVAAIHSFKERYGNRKYMWLIRSIVRGDSQSMMARELNMTKQGVGRLIRRMFDSANELRAIIQERKEEAERRKFDTV